MHHGVEADRLGGECGLDKKFSVLNKRVGPVVVVNLELPVATATHGHLVLPGLQVELVKVVREDESLRSCNNGDCS